MRDNVYSMDDFKKANKKFERKEWIKNKFRDFECWFYNNKDLAVILIPAGIAGAGLLVKGGGKAINGLIRHANLKKEEGIKNLYCYDRSLGHYWKLKRPLSNSEWVSIDKRKKAGERLSDILEELKVLA